MGDKKRREIAYLNNVKKIKEAKYCIVESIKKTHENIKQESELIRELKKHEIEIDFVDRFYSEADIGVILNLNEEQYKASITPMITATNLVPLYKSIYNSTNEKTESLKYDNDVIIAATNVTNTFLSTAKAIVSSEPKAFKGSKNLFQRHDHDIIVDKDIKFIQKILKNITPNISDDFDHFLKAYYAFEQSACSYQEFIGYRSMFYLKLIFPYVLEKYGLEKPRNKAIEKFIFGTNSVNNGALSIIKISNDLYKELSNQSNSSMSVKLGNTTPEYTRALFIRIIENMTSVLKLRNTYFKE